MKSKYHKEAIKKHAGKQQQENRIASFSNYPVENKSKALELRLAMLVTQRNLAFSLPKDINSILKKELTSNPVLNHLSTWGKLRLQTSFEKVYNQTRTFRIMILYTQFLNLI
jgi:hypothetical protein